MQLKRGKYELQRMTVERQVLEGFHGMEEEERRVD
jgi:hypothetical protein